MGILDLFRLDEKVALVTGASRGLGQAMAIGLAEAGANIVGLDLTGCEDTCSQIEALGKKYHSILCDLKVTSTKQLGAIVEEVVEAMGRLDILVNNAGIIRRAPFSDFTEKDWDDVMNVNIRGLFFLSQAVVKTMIEQGRGGKIINTASMLSFQGGILVPSYTTSKSGVMGLTRLMACELAKHNIHTNAIAPGYMATDNTKPLREDPVRNQAILDRIPAGRWGKPEDLQGVAVFLASPASDYMNGYTVAVDGGWLAR